MTDQTPTAATVKDPVCGMDVDPTTAKHTSEYQGQRYVFCSLSCKQAFDNDPQRYAQQQRGAGSA